MTKEPDGTFRCGECGLRYADAVKAVACEEWCKAHHSCNIEIIKDAVDEGE